jgi:preprotein translocase subunit SecD
MRRRRGSLSLIVFVLAALIALTLTLVVGNTPLLGLDLQGGVSVVLQPKEEVDSDALDQTISIIRQRVDALGVAEPEITRQGDTVLVQIPGVKDRDRAIELVGQTAELRFRPVLGEAPVGATIVEPPTNTAPGDTAPTDTAPGDTAPTDTAPGDTAPTDTAPTETAPADPSDPSESTETSIEGSTDTGEQGLRAGEGEVALGRQPSDSITDQGTTDTAPIDPVGGTTTDTTLGATDPAPVTSTPTLPDDVCTAGVPPEQDLPDQTVTLPFCDPDTNTLLSIFTLGPTLLLGDSLETARATLTPNGEWVVNPAFRGGADGIDKFNAAAGQCFSQAPSCPTGRLAIVLDSRVVSAPNIQQASFERDGIQITGSFTERSARDLATVLKYGALPVELERQQVQIVSATLGQDALEAGLWAGLVGFILVAIYMIAFYRILGVMAITKLVLEAALLWSIISYLGVNNGLALTLAGITGLIVSIGVSVDSNVVYYEHIKEDVRGGRTIRSATDKSFVTAWSTIVKADVSSLIGASLLWWLTVGPVRGFAFYLGLSTVLDLIASYFFMRPAVKRATQSGLASRRPKLFGLPEGPVDGDAPVSPVSGEKATVST